MLERLDERLTSANACVGAHLYRNADTVGWNTGICAVLTMMLVALEPIIAIGAPLLQPVILFIAIVVGSVIGFGMKWLARWANADLR